MTSPKIYLKSSQSKKFQENDKKVVFWHYPKFDKKYGFRG